MYVVLNLGSVLYTWQKLIQLFVKAKTLTLWNFVALQAIQKTTKLQEKQKISELHAPLMEYTMFIIATIVPIPSFP